MEIIKTERLELRPMCMEYLESTHEYASDPENTTYMIWLPNDSIEETKGYIEGAEKEFEKESPNFYEMAIFLGETHIGAVSLYLNEDKTEGEFGWLISKNYWGLGYAYEAASALLEYGSNELGLRKFTAHCDTENVASRRVMEKLGMTFISESGGRKNKQSMEERREYLFGLNL